MKTTEKTRDFVVRALSPANASSHAAYPLGGESFKSARRVAIRDDPIRG